MRPAACALAILVAALAPSSRAADVAATVTNGSLHLVGTVNTENVVIDQVGVGANQFRIVPGASTSVNGSMSAVTLGGVTKDVVVALDEGIDSVTIDTARVKRDVVLHGGAAGTLTFVLQDASVGRDVRGDTTVSSLGWSAFGSSIGRNLRFVGGSAGDQCVLIGSLVRGNVVFEGNGGADTVNFIGSRVRGKISGDGGDSNEQFILQEVRCGKGVDWDTGSGSNTVTLSGLECDRGVSIRGGGTGNTINLLGCAIGGETTLDAGAGSGVVQFGSCDFTRSLRLRGGSGTELVTTTQAFHVGRDVRVDLGGGLNSTTLGQAVIDGNVRCKGGAGNDSLHLGNATVGGSVRADVGASASTDDVDVAVSRVHGGVRVRAAGSVSVTFLTATIDGETSVTSGATLSTVGALGARFRELRIAFGGASDTVSMSNVTIDQNLGITAGEGNNDTSIFQSVIGGDLRVTAGAGNDSVALTNSVVVGKTHVDLGGGTNTGP